MDRILECALAELHRPMRCHEQMSVIAVSAVIRPQISVMFVIVVFVL